MIAFRYEWKPGIDRIKTIGGKPLPKGWRDGITEARIARVIEVERLGPRVMPANHEKGYVRLCLGRSHPYAYGGGGCSLHRYLMQSYLGRVLDTYEHVHHVNGDKQTLDIFELDVLDDITHGHYHYGERLGCGREYRTESPAGRAIELDENGLVGSPPSF